MYTMKPIKEPDVIALLNNNRFEGDLQGYILSDGQDLFGWTLFRVDVDTTVLLDVKAPDNRFLDGLVRASVAMGESQGALFFSFNTEIESYKEYKRVFFAQEDSRISNEKLFAGCKH